MPAIIDTSGQYVSSSSKSQIFLRPAKPNYQQTFLEKCTRQ